MDDEIERTREMMIATASSKGLGASETIEISRKLDALLNDYGSDLDGGKADDSPAYFIDTMS